LRSLMVERLMTSQRKGLPKEADPKQFAIWAALLFNVDTRLHPKYTRFPRDVTRFLNRGSIRWIHVKQPSGCKDVFSIVITHLVTSPEGCVIITGDIASMAPKSMKTVKLLSDAQFYMGKG